FLLHQWQVLLKVRDALAAADARVAALSAAQREAYLVEFTQTLSVAFFRLVHLMKPMLDAQPVALDLPTLTTHGFRAAHDAPTAHVTASGAAHSVSAARDFDDCVRRAQYDQPQTKIKTYQDQLDEAAEQLQKQLLLAQQRARAPPTPPATAAPAPPPATIHPGMTTDRDT
ncbi:hypothetical protein GNI_166220, partial [Gregarina niphandrodes]